MIGGNDPPAFEAFSLHIEELFSLVSATTAGATVETDEQEAALDGLLDDMRKARKDADAERAAEKKPHDDAAKAVQAKWKPLLDRCDMGAEEIKRLLTPYRVAKQKAKDEAEAAARAEAQAKLEAAQAAFQQPDDLEARFAAEADLKVATKLNATANRISREATGLRTQWSATVEDYTAFARWAWEHRQSDLHAFLDELAGKEVRAGQRALPGVNINEERKAA